MAVPKQRHTKSRRNKRRSQIFLKEPALVSCQKCKKPTLSHVVCRNCGFYRGMEIIDVLKKMTKKEKKEKQKEIATSEKSANELSMEEMSKKK